MTENQNNIKYQNPKDGKMPMLLGILGVIGGMGTVGTGLVGLVSKIGTRGHSVGESLENAKGLMVGGVALVACGAALYGVGRLQHWYSNKTY